MANAEWRLLSARAREIALENTWDHAADRFLAALELARERTQQGDFARGRTV
jgi:hypothetical protein